MENYLLKLRLIFWPFVRLTLVVAGGYAAFWAVLVWALGAALGVELRQVMDFQFWFFGLLGAATVLLGLRPRIHLLRAGHNDRWRTLFYMVAAATVALATGATAAAAQLSLLRLVTLRDVSELPRYPANTAYALRRVYLASNRTTFQDIYSRGKGGPSLTIYAATPLLASAADTVEVQAIAWVGMTFRASGKVRTGAYDDYSGFADFNTATTNAVKATGTPGFTYLTRASRSPEMLAAVSRSPWAARLKVRPVVLEAHYEPFSQRAEASLRLLRLALQWGFGLFLGMLLFPRLHAGHVQRYLDAGVLPTHAESWRRWLLQARLRPGFFATPIFIGLNTVAFLAMTGAGLGFLSIDTVDLVDWGAGHGPSGEWWRLFVGPLLQDGAFHYLNGVWALAWVGWHLERMVGKRWLAVVYALAALAGGLASRWGQPGTVVVGPAAAIMGLFGFGLVLCWRSSGREGIKVEMLSTLAFTYAFVEFFIGLASDRINWALPMGGAVAGVLLGLAVQNRFTVVTPLKAS